MLTKSRIKCNNELYFSECKEFLYFYRENILYLFSIVFEQKRWFKMKSTLLLIAHHFRIYREKPSTEKKPWSQRKTETWFEYFHLNSIFEHVVIRLRKTFIGAHAFSSKMGKSEFAMDTTNEHGYTFSTVYTFHCSYSWYNERHIHWMDILYSAFSFIFSVLE